jgi:hypothetical protein
MTHVPYDLKQILLKHKSNGIDKKLPELNTQCVLQKYEYYNTPATSKYVSNFLLNAVTQLILDVYILLQKADFNVAVELIKYIIKSIVDSERLVSKPDDFKFMTSKFKNDDDVYVGNIDDDDDARDGYTSNTESVGDIYDAVDEDPDDQFDTGDLDMERDAEENFEQHHDIF